MASNAWERAQEAIARAAERDAAVITPDTAVSPFDASRTTVIPHVQAARHGSADDPDVTQRLPHRGNGAHGGDPPGAASRNGHPVGGADDQGDARTDRFDARPRPGPSLPSTAPFPANPFPSGGTAPGRRSGAELDPSTSDAPAHDETPASDPPRRPWWRRLFG